MLVVGRIISGLSVGLASAVVPIYQSEITAPHIRGRLVSLQQWFAFLRSSGVSPSLKKIFQVDHLGYPPPVLSSVWMLLYQWHRFIPNSLGPADDSCHNPLYRHDGLPRESQVAVRPQQVCFGENIYWCLN